MKDLMLKLYVKAQILREEHGQDMVEYCLVVGFIGLGCIVGMKGVATSIQGMFTNLGDALGKIAFPSA